MKINQLVQIVIFRQPKNDVFNAHVVEIRADGWIKVIPIDSKSEVGKWFNPAADMISVREV